MIKKLMLMGIFGIVLIAQSLHAMKIKEVKNKTDKDVFVMSIDMTGHGEVRRVIGEEFSEGGIVTVDQRQPGMELIVVTKAGIHYPSSRYASWPADYSMTINEDGSVALFRLPGYEPVPPQLNPKTRF